MSRRMSQRMRLLMTRRHKADSLTRIAALLEINLKYCKRDASKIELCVVINVLTYVNQNRNHLAVLDFST